jgi:hypothetical protein
MEGTYCSETSVDIQPTTRRYIKGSSCFPESLQANARVVSQIRPGPLLSGSRDSAVGIATSDGLDDRGVGVRVPVWVRIFSSPPRPD